jgi:KDO2-lipid IV(A) lauroyltransferase
MIAFVRLLSRLPLSKLQALGRTLGWIPYLWSRRYRHRMRANLVQAGYPGSAMARAVAREMGCGALELAFIWMRPVPEVIKYVVDVVGGEILDRARETGQGIVFLSPHLGCFELGALYLGSLMPLTVLYRPPRMRWLEPLMLHGRARGLVKTGSTDIGGVRKQLRALKSGEAVGLLPDQVPGEGAGQWASFFGRPAYTSTLAARLAESTGAKIVMVFCERLPRGAGYIMRLHELSLGAQSESSARLINRQVELLIGLRPTQYLWSYNRYKTPAGAAKPPAEAETKAAGSADFRKEG